MSEERDTGKEKNNKTKNLVLGLLPNHQRLHVLKHQTVMSGVGFVVLILYGWFSKLRKAILVILISCTKVCSMPASPPPHTLCIPGFE